MYPSKCEVHACEGKVEVDLVYAMRYARARVVSYCAAHAADALEEITCGFASPGHLPARMVTPCAVDIELVICDARESSPCQFVLREINGPRRLTLQVGRFEAWMLDWELRHEPTPSVPTHRAMAATIRALGGDLKKVTIYDVSEGERYHAQLHISQGDSPTIVDVRPSDAIVLAVVCNVPINVDSLVWQKILA